MTWVKEGGHNDTVEPLVSLGGVLGSPGRGREIELSNFALTGGYTIPENPKRIALLIENCQLDTGISQAGAIQVFFSISGGGYLVLSAGDSLQIDKNLPYTGGIVLASLAPATVGLIEVSVP